MGFLIGLFTVVLVLDCLALMLLVLIQLPKKDAGAGLAFGGGATDALFGAGSGNVLTKITKYAATIFFILSVGLSVMQRHYHSQTTSAFEQGLMKPSAAPVAPAETTAPAATPQAPASKPAAATTTSNTLTTTPAAIPSTSNAAPAAPKKQ